MTTYVKSINRKVWKVVETKIEVANPEAPSTARLWHLTHHEKRVSQFYHPSNWFSNLAIMKQMQPTGIHFV